MAAVHLDPKRGEKRFTHMVSAKRERHPYGMSGPSRYAPVVGDNPGGHSGVYRTKRRGRVGGLDATAVHPPIRSRAKSCAPL